MKNLCLLALLTVSVSVSAHYSCEGSVHYLAAGTSLIIDNGYGKHTACNLENDTAKCNAWLSIAMSAQAQNRNIRMYYFDTTGKADKIETCNQIGDWVTPDDPIYLIQIK